MCYDDHVEKFLVLLGAILCDHTGTVVYSCEGV